MKNKNEIKIILTITTIVISIFILIQALPISNDSIYHYTIFQNTDYKVYLNKNDFFSQEYLEKDNIYLKDLTRYIEFNFEYAYNASAKENLSSKYNIIATLYIEYANTGQIILKKDYPIIENKTIQSLESNNIDITEKINIDYQKYNSEVEKFKEQFGLPITSYLVINFNTETGRQNGANQISVSKATIDLNSPAYEIKIKESADQENTIIETQETSKDINYLLLTIGIIIFIPTMIYLLYQIWKYQMTQQNNIKIRVNKILKKYKEIIVELEAEPKINMKNVIDVKSFEELIDVEEEIRLPILFYEDKEKYVFLIVDYRIVYRKSFFK